MKKIRCDWDEEDFLNLEVVEGSDVIVIVKQGDKRSRVRICPEKIRKLRKQLKRALIEIEGEEKKAQYEEYKPGDRVYLIEGDGDGSDWFNSPSTVDIDLTVPVELIEIKKGTRWILKYTTISGKKETGYACEKSFGRRA